MCVRKIIYSAIAFLFVATEGCSFLSRDPVKVLPMIVEMEFGIKINEINPVVTDYEEVWCPSGDGFCRIEFKYEGDHPDFFQRFRLLPFNENWERRSTLSVDYWNLQEGYYLFKADVDDPRDYFVLIINAANHTGILFYELTT